MTSPRPTTSSSHDQKGSSMSDHTETLEELAKRIASAKEFL